MSEKKAKELQEKKIADAFTRLEIFPVEAQKQMLLSVLRIRRQWYQISINGAILRFERRLIRDYLKKKYPEVKNRRGIK